MGARNSSLEKPASKVEQRLVQALVERAQRGQSTLKTFNSIILKFPQIDKSFEGVRAVFKKFDLNGSGAIDLHELKKCLEELQVKLTDKEMKDIYEESDFDGSREIEFKEFIVLLALVYFLGLPTPSDGSSEPQSQSHAQAQASPSRLGMPRLEATFETIVEAFVFMDSNGDGYISKSDVIDSVNNVSPSKHADRIGVARFEEMDWDHNGQITFKEFLFAFTDWVGLEEDEEDDDGGT